MSWELLPVNYTDAVWSGLKRYNTITNEDGTVSFQDVTAYSNKETSFFGARDANKKWIVREVSGDRAVIDKSEDGKNAICSPINTQYLSVVSAASTPSQSAWTPQVGDYVSFTGKVHYASSNSDREVSCKGGKAKITQIYTKGKHPYHLVNMGGGCTVYGWVDRSTFTKA